MIDRAKRFLNIDDVLALESFNRSYGPLFAFSPDRTILAVVITSAFAVARGAGPQFLAGVERAVTCLINMTTGDVQRCRGPDGCGLFSPVWSPCGMFLAAVATDGKRVRPCIMDMASKKVIFLGEQDIHIEFSPVAGICWIDPTTIVCRLLPRGQCNAAISLTRDTTHISAAVWKKQQRGQQPTASVLLVRTELKLSEVAYIDIKTRASVAVDIRDAVPLAVAEFACRTFPSTTISSQLQDLYAKERLLFAETPTTNTLVLTRGEDGPTRLVLRSRRPRKELRLLTCNQHLVGVKKGSVRNITYRLANADQAVIRCVLPPDWRDGQRRPAVVFVYPEYVCDVGSFHKRMLDQPWLSNHHLLAAEGYVVLEPSLPFCRADKGKLVDSLITGVAPAIKAASDAGLIDKENVHVVGHSRGGWAVMALLAATNLFRSGISLAGFSDLIALHGQLDVRSRYRDSYDGNGLDQICEDSFALSGPPARYASEYFHNSPLFHAASINVPLLLMHGDLDYYPPITQSEAMFHALHRLGKPVELVRYWGEEHVFTSPANIRDAHERIVAWLQALSSSVPT